MQGERTPLVTAQKSKHFKQRKNSKMLGKQSNISLMNEVHFFILIIFNKK